MSAGWLGSRLRASYVTKRHELPPPFVFGTYRIRVFVSDAIDVILVVIFINIQ